MPKPAIEVTGMKELRTSLRKLDASLTDVVAAGNREAAKFVEREAKALAGSKGAQARRAAGTMKVSATPRAGSITLQNTRDVPYVIGAEFGAKHNVPRPMRRKGKGYQMRGWNNLPLRVKEGRFLWPTIRGKRPQIVKAYEDEVERLKRKLNL